MSAAHNASTYQTAVGWRWGCSCGRVGNGVGTPTAAGAQAAANRHVVTALRKARQDAENLALGVMEEVVAIAERSRGR